MSEPTARRDDVRNVAIIAHVDHGKTTLVDALLRQSGEFREGTLGSDLVLDSNDLERERGITILSKNISLPYRGTRVNIIDTPGHADFGGEVERVLRMADGALILVDAFEGPRPQTRFVVGKALEVGLKPIVVVNKIDRPNARPEDVLSETFDLFAELGADDETLDFKYLFASGMEGYASDDPDARSGTIAPILDAVLGAHPRPGNRPGRPAGGDGHQPDLQRIRRPRGDGTHRLREVQAGPEGRADAGGRLADAGFDHRGRTVRQARPGRGAGGDGGGHRRPHRPAGPADRRHRHRPGTPRHAPPGSPWTSRR